MTDSRPGPSPAANKGKDLLANAIPIEVALDDGDAGVDLEPPDGQIQASSKIRTFARPSSPTENWRRKPTTNGQGATHCRTFVAKLRPEALEHLDQQVNDWLDEHPDYEVKLVTTSVGQLSGKTPEDALVMNVWV